MKSKIRTWFWIFAALIIVLSSILAYEIFRLTSYKLFIVTECMILAMAVFLLLFYFYIVKPIHLIGNGMDLLKEQDFSSRLKYVGQTDADRIVDIFNRMMSQLKDERLHLREQNQFLDLLINASPMGVIILDLDRKVQSMNPAAMRVLGNDPFGKNIDAFSIDKDDNKDIENNRNNHTASALLMAELSRMKPGDTQTIRLNDANIYKCSCLTFSDKGFQHTFFLLETLTEEVFKAERKAYEKVIRMIAHEVNNSTAGITSTLDTVQSAIEEMPETEDITQAIRVVMERCYSMSQFITGFADVVKIPEPHIREIDLNQLIRDHHQLMESMCLHRNIRIHLQLSEPSPIVFLDDILFDHVLINVIKNAAEAIDHDGDIYITTTLRPTVLEIADTGCGISEEAASKLFTPFYSSKPNGQGLGLIFIREVLIKHGFRFSLRSYPDKLTRFSIEMS